MVPSISISIEFPVASCSISSLMLTRSVALGSKLSRFLYIGMGEYINAAQKLLVAFHFQLTIVSPRISLVWVLPGCCMFSN